MRRKCRLRYNLNQEAQRNLAQKCFLITCSHYLRLLVVVEEEENT